MKNLLFIPSILLLLGGCSGTYDVEGVSNINKKIHHACDPNKADAYSLCGKYIEEVPDIVTEAVLNNVWTHNKGKLSASLQNRHANDKTYIYYIQSHTNNLLLYAFKHKKEEIIEELLQLYLQAHAHLRIVETEEDGSQYRGWLSMQHGRMKENIINSSQFVYLLSKTMSLISEIPENQHTPLMKTFINTYWPVVNQDSLYRWIASPFQYFQGRCAKKKNKKGVVIAHNHRQYIRKLLTKQLDERKTGRSYCHFVRDQDLWIIAATSEALKAKLNLSELPMSAEWLGRYKEYLRFGTRLVESRLSETQLLTFSGEQSTGMIFDGGSWSDFPDYKHAGYIGAEFPVSRDSRRKSNFVGWDISHARRFVHVFKSLSDNRMLYDSTHPNFDIQKGMANQLIYGVYNRSLSQPLFSNYFDGSDGWYRVGYNGRKGFGHGPSSLSKEALTGGFAIWKEHNADVRVVFSQIWARIYKGTKLPGVYTCPFYFDFKLKCNAAEFDLHKSMSLLSFLPALLL